jgi:hypothetical protein
MRSLCGREKPLRGECMQSQASEIREHSCFPFIILIQFHVLDVLEINFKTHLFLRKSLPILVHLMLLL